MRVTLPSGSTRVRTLPRGSYSIGDARDASGIITGEGDALAAGVDDAARRDRQRVAVEVLQPRDPPVALEVEHAPVGGGEADLRGVEHAEGVGIDDLAAAV